MTKGARRATPSATELLVLDRSRRRCALCYQIDNDLFEKHGQIAHLDQDPTNFAEGNLAWLCLRHHSLYDSKTSQHKNYTQAEVKAARSRLYAAIRRNLHISRALPAPGLGRNEDRKTLDDIMVLIDDDVLTYIKDFGMFGYGFPDRVILALGTLVEARQEAKHEFLDPELEKLRRSLIRCVNELGGLLGNLNGRSKSQPNWSFVPSDLEDDKPDVHHRVVCKLTGATAAVYRAFDDLVRKARQRLAR